MKMMELSFALLVGLASLHGGDPAAKAILIREAAPVFCLETGLHTASVRALSVSQDGRIALTASEDKTARIWDLATGRLIRTLRPPVEAGKVGMLYAAALSPDGQIAALGGWTRGSRDPGHRILIVDVATGVLLRTFEAGPQVVNHLAFSPDGARLVAHLGGRLGLRVLRVADGAPLGQDLDFDDVSYRGAFDARGRYAATADDGFIRLYDPGFRRLLKVKAAAGAPFGVAFSPDGERLALGYADSPRVQVLAAATLDPAFEPGPGVRPLGLVAWSSDGRTLYAAGGEDFPGPPNVLRRWEQGGQGPGTEAPLARATVSDLQALPGGELAFAAQDPAWGVVDGQGRPRFLQAIHQDDLRQDRDRFRIDARGARVALPGRVPGQPGLCFDLDELQVGPEAGLAAPAPAAADLGLEDWKDGARPKVNGHPVGLEPYEIVRSAVARAEGRGCLLGTDWYLRAVDREGRELWKRPASAAVWGLALAADGRAAVAMLADGTFRWFRAADGNLLLSLYVAPDRRWVAWTPSGRFASSVAGEPLAGWQVNRTGQMADFFGIAHFRSRFWNPELLPLLLETLDEDEALARLQAGPAPATAPRPEEYPPVLRILSPGENGTVPGGAATFRVALRTYGEAAAVRDFRVFLDGRRLPPRRGLRPERAEVLADGVDRTYPVPVDLPPKGARVGFQAELEGGRRSDLVQVHVRVAGTAAPAAPARPPALRALCVGVSEYADPRNNLLFSAKDAGDVAALFRKQEGGLYGKVEVALLTNAQATETAILAAMDRFRDASRPQDVTIYFFSSHGATDSGAGTYLMVPFDYGQGSQGIPGRAIKDRLEATQGKAIMLMDTCHSGDVLGQGRMRGFHLNNRLAGFINELVHADPGVVVFSSSTGAQLSMESPVWGNGAFTKALREGLGGAADPRRTGRVTTALLDAWLRSRVAELTLDRQTPVSAQAESAVPFPLVVD